MSMRSCLGQAVRGLRRARTLATAAVPNTAQRLRRAETALGAVTAAGLAAYVTATPQIPARAQETAVDLDATSPVKASTGRPHTSDTLIVDTDVGLDDIAAITLLATSGFAVKLITTTCGICRPGTGAFHVQQLVCALGLIPASRVVSGAEHGRREPHKDWEHEQHKALSLLCAILGTRAHVCAPPSMEAAADAILEVARKKAGDRGETLTILALGSMSNLGAAAQRDPAAFARIDRIIFIGNARTPKAKKDYHHQPYNAWIDPDALRVVLRSGVPLILIGQACYPERQWCSALVDNFAQAGAAPSASAPLAARILWGILQYDAEQLAYDPLAVFYLVQPEAFVGCEPMAVRVSEGVAWRFEQCTAADAPDAEGVVEFRSVSLARYRDWLTSSLTRTALL